MICKKAVFVVVTNIMLMQFCYSTVAYRQISGAGNGSALDRGGPKIYKAVNFDLLFPKSFNSSENVISTTPESIPSPTNTATNVVGQPYYPLPESNQPTNTAATAGGNQQEPTIFVTPASTQHEPTPLAATSHDAQPNTKSIKYNSQVVTQYGINMQQQQQPHKDNDKAEKEQQRNYATGRAVDYRTSYPFGQVITPLIKTAPRPVQRQPITSFPAYPSSSSSLSSPTAKLAAPANVGKIIYPQAMYQQKPPSQAEIDKLRGKGTFADRFSPSEGVAAHAFKTNNNGHDHSHDYHNHDATYKAAGGTPFESNTSNSYVSDSNLYAFPPNNVNYPTMHQDTKVSLSSDAVNSYSWPASGSLTDSNNNPIAPTINNNPYQYNGPASVDYLPAENDGESSENRDANKNNEPGGNDDGDLDNGAGDDSAGVLPASAMDQANSNINADMTSDMVLHTGQSHQSQHEPDDHSYDTEKEYATPPPSWLKAHPEAVQDHPHDDHYAAKPVTNFGHEQDFHHHPDIIFDHEHNHDHYHPSFPSYKTHAIHHHYPEIIYDNHHDHPHIEHAPPITTQAPPPEPPPEPRVKKYSYFYIGRKLWYIPLYFTVWFSFYVLWLILKSIARHKVNLPNHYVARRSLDNHDLRHQQEVINQLTVNILDKIDKFKRKYN